MTTRGPAESTPTETAPPLTPEWDRGCEHVKNPDGRKYVCEGCARAALAALQAENAELRRECFVTYEGLTAAVEQLSVARDKSAAAEGERDRLRDENTRLRGLLPAETLDEFARRVAALQRAAVALAAIPLTGPISSETAPAVAAAIDKTFEQDAGLLRRLADSPRPTPVQEAARMWREGETAPAASVGLVVPVCAAGCGRPVKGGDGTEELYCDEHAPAAPREGTVKP